MPETPIQNPVVVEELINHPEDRRELVLTARATPDIFRTLYPESEYVGIGRQVITMGHPGDEKKVVAYNIFSKEFSENPIRALEIYHLHRFLNLAFPHNFPKFHAVRGGDNAQSVRQRIYSSPNQDTKKEFPLKDVKRKCERMGFPLFLDSNVSNFTIAIDGGEYYLDTVTYRNSQTLFQKLDLDKVEKHFREQEKNGEVNLRKAMFSLRRLAELEILSDIANSIKFSDAQVFTTQGFELMLEKEIGLQRLMDKDSISRIIRFLDIADFGEDGKEKKLIAINLLAELRKKEQGEMQ